MTIIIVLVLAHLALAAVAVPMIVRGQATDEQRRLQIAMALLVPFVGSGLAIAVHAGDRRRRLDTREPRELGTSIQDSPYAGADHDTP